MTICMLAIIGIGFLMKYILISGQERWDVYVRNVELYFFGMNRHQWGMLHLILACVFFGLLFVHIVFHWKVISNVYRKIIKKPVLNKIATLVFVILCVLLNMLPFFMQPEIEILQKEKGRQVTIVTQLR